MEEDSYKAMMKLLDMDDPPTAVFSSNNMTTLGCLRCLKERRLKLGRDISVVGFDDIKELEYTDTHLTAVTRPVYEMGCEAMRIWRGGSRTGRDDGGKADHTEESGKNEPD